MTPPSLSAPTGVLIDADAAVGIEVEGRPRDVDDGFAIAQALFSEYIDVVGITTVFGNAPLPETTRVARRIVELSGLTVSVHCGAAEALSRPDIEPESDAVRFIAESLEARPLTILALGPLTNVAQLVRSRPDLVHRIECVVAVMGRRPGHVFWIGGKGPLRDFNFESDPEAVRVLLDAGVPLRLTPFELSRKVSLTPEVLAPLREGGPLARYLWAGSQAWMAHWLRNFPSDDGFHPWDSLAVLAIALPHMLTVELVEVSIQSHEDSAHGVGAERTGEESHARPTLEVTPAALNRGAVMWHEGYQAHRREQVPRAILSWALHADRGYGNRE